MFKGIVLKTAQSSRRGNASFDHGKFVQALVDNVKARMINERESEFLNDSQTLVPERWRHAEETPWVAGEDMILRICRRFNIKTNNIVTSYREFSSDPRTTNPLIQEKLVKGLLEIIPIRSAEAERGFFQLNLICTKLRSSLSVSHLSS